MRAARRGSRRLLPRLPRLRHRRRQLLQPTRGRSPLAPPSRAVAWSRRPRWRLGHPSDAPSPTSAAPPQPQLLPLLPPRPRPSRRPRGRPWRLCEPCRRAKRRARGTPRCPRAGCRRRDRPSPRDRAPWAAHPSWRARSPSGRRCVRRAGPPLPRPSAAATPPKLSPRRGPPPAAPTRARRGPRESLRRPPEQSGHPPTPPTLPSPPLFSWGASRSCSLAPSFGRPKRRATWIPRRRCCRRSASSRSRPRARRRRRTLDSPAPTRTGAAAAVERGRLGRGGRGACVGRAVFGSLSTGLVAVASFVPAQPVQRDPVPGRLPFVRPRVVCEACGARARARLCRSHGRSPRPRRTLPLARARARTLRLARLRPTDKSARIALPANRA